VYQTAYCTSVHVTMKLHSICKTADTMQIVSKQFTTLMYTYILVLKTYHAF